MTESDLPAYWRLPVVLCLITICISILWQRRSTSSKSLPLPPQPKGKGLLGSMRALIKAGAESLPHLLLQEWAQEYGEIFRVRLGPVTEYFLNSDHAVKEIMDRASAVSSGRPRWIVSNELMCNQLNVLFLHGNDPRWKHQRRAINSYLTSVSKADAGVPYLHYETAKLLHEIANDPKAQNGVQIQRLLARYTYSAFATQSFGMDIPRGDDPVIDYIHETGLASILGTLPGTYLVEIFPWLEHLPLFLKPWERDARERFKRDLDWCMARLERIKDPKLAGKIMPDAFLPSVLRAPDQAGFTTQEEAAYLSLQLVIGAADTSQMSTWSFLEAMLQYPEAQNKARAEIEAVVGNRLPEYADLENIPYMRCVMKEVWRWRPPVPLGHPHVTTKEIVYKGHRIPKGASLHLNAWAISRDPKRHQDPDRFWPERFADDHTTTMQSINSPDVTKRDHFAFGAGRRICPGYHVAERSLAIAMMRILWAFDIQWSPGTPQPVDPMTYMRHSEIPGVPSSRLPVSLRPRSPQKTEIINKTFEALGTERLPLIGLA